jgi:hypothetical protein
MPHTELQRLMHAVLDGEATPAEAEELTRRLAADAAARAEFDSLRRLFADLARLPQKQPPEGLAAAVTSALPGIARANERSDQPFGGSRVLQSTPDEIRIRHGRPAPVPPTTTRTRFTMNNPHPPYSAPRKALLGGGIAIAAGLIVWHFGFDPATRSEDVAGTIAAAERYRAPQEAGDVKLGDQSLAQLMQNDAFVKLIRDPQVQALAREPGFVEAARLMKDNPDLARMFATYAEPAKVALAQPELAKVMAENAEAAARVQLVADLAARVRASAEAEKLVAGNAELERYMKLVAELGKIAPWGGNVAADRAIALNAETAERFAKLTADLERVAKNVDLNKLAAQNADLERFAKANEDAMRFAKKYVEVSKVLAGNQDVARLANLNADAARFFVMNAEAARVLAARPDVARVVAAYPDAAVRMMSSPEAARLLNNPEAARMALVADATGRVADSTGRVADSTGRVADETGRVAR